MARKDKTETMEYLQGTNNKAIVIEIGNEIILYSYTKRVATYNKLSKKVEVHGYYSVTTGRHINKFFRLFDLKPMTKSQIIEKYNLSI